MEYLNRIQNKIVGPTTIKVRRGREKDIGGSPRNTSIPLYAIMEGNGASYAYSNMELVNRFAQDISSIKVPINISIEFKGNPKLYPNNCPKQAIESMVFHHNKLVTPYNTPIGEPNPFAEKMLPVLTRKEALRIIGSKNNR